MNRVTLLHEEMNMYLMGWKDNEKVTPFQKLKWPQHIKITHGMLGFENPNCLKLLKEDEYDGKPVGSLSDKMAKGFFDQSQDIWPPDRDLIRFAIFFHLNFYQALALVLKGQWEYSLGKKINWKEDFEGRNRFEILRNGIDEIDRDNFVFNPGLYGRANASELYTLFQQHKGSASKEGYNETRFNTLIQLMIKHNIYLFSNNSPELTKFIKEQRNEQNALRKSSKEESDKYWQTKCFWLELEDEVGSLLLNLEKQRLDNADCERKWLAAFGHVYLPLLELEVKYHSLNRCLNLKKADESLSIEEIEELQIQIIKEEQEQLEQLKLDISFAQAIKDQNFRDIGGEELSNYEEECRKILREIWRLTHPDRILSETVYKNSKKEIIRIL